MAVYVVDQSAMRRPLLAERIQSERAAEFVIPDIVFVEVMKSSNWEATLRSSFVAFAPAVDRTFVSLGVSEIIRRETAGERIGRDVLLPDAFRDFIRMLIRPLNVPSGVTPHLRSRIEAIRPAVLAEAAAEKEKKRLVGLVTAMKAEADPQTVRAIKDNRMSAEARLRFIKASGDQIYLDHVASTAGHIAREALKAKPMALRRTYLLFRLTLRWLVHAGLDNADPAVILNHWADQDYALLGSYFDGVLTNDRQLSEAASELRLLLQADADLLS
jgi:hypothetical protein